MWTAMAIEIEAGWIRGTLYIEGSRGRFLSKAMKPMGRCGDLANANARELGVEVAIIDGEIVVIAGSVRQCNALMMIGSRETRNG